MKLKMGLRILLAAALAWAALGSVGCGQMARDAIKSGVFNYATGNNFVFNQALGALTSLVTNTVTGVGGSNTP